MAELDKDRSGISGSANRPGETPGDRGTTWTAGSQDSASLSAVGDAAREGLDEAKQRAADVASRAKEKGRRMFAGQKDVAAEQFDSVASALRKTADQLHNEDKSQTGEYVGFAAEKLESFGQRLRAKDLDSLIADAEDLGRRSPVAFFAGSVAAGFLLSRFLKSSAERRASPDQYRGQDRRAERFADSPGDSDRTRTSYMDTGATGTSAETNASYAGLRNTAPAPDGGGTETVPLPTSDNPQGGSYGL